MLYSSTVLFCYCVCSSVLYQTWNKQNWVLCDAMNLCVIYLIYFVLVTVCFVGCMCVCLFVCY